VIEILWPLIVFGFFMWLVDQFVPMEDNVKRIFRIFSGVLALAFVLGRLGVIPQIV
jgi:hypothetical protein